MNCLLFNKQERDGRALAVPREHNSQLHERDRVCMCACVSVSLDVCVCE
jgi:hypothetical protein